MSCYTAEEKRAMWESEDLPTMKARIATMQARIDALEKGYECCCPKCSTLLAVTPTSIQILEAEK